MATSWQLPQSTSCLLPRTQPGLCRVDRLSRPYMNISTFALGVDSIGSSLRIQIVSSNKLDTKKPFAVQGSQRQARTGLVLRYCESNRRQPCHSSSAAESKRPRMAVHHCLRASLPNLGHLSSLCDIPLTRENSKSHRRPWTSSERYGGLLAWCLFLGGQDRQV